MNRVLVLAGLVWSFSLVVGCSSSKSPTAAGAGASNASGAAGSASGGAAGQSSTPTAGSAGMKGPVITSAPAAWARPADCGGIGDLCPNLFGCKAGQSTCQLEGNVCIPAFPAGATSLPGRTAETPYCAAYTCMTFDQASCFCTGEAGKTVATCESPSALAQLCVLTGKSCDSEACCAGSSCVASGNGHKQCAVTCQINTDCPDTGCCTDPHEVGVKICSPKAACDNPCKKVADTSCTPSTTTTASNCCNGACIQSTIATFAGCRPLCIKNTDCTSSCCEPFSDGASGFCVDAALCGCSNAGGACGPGAPACCDGSSCAGNDSGGFECFPSCKIAEDCATKCCALFTGESNGVCVAASECGL